MSYLKPHTSDIKKVGFLSGSPTFFLCLSPMGLQVHGHAGGDKEGLSVATEVLGVDEVAVADAVGEFLAELVERLVALVTGRLDFDGPDLGATREDEIDLVVVVGGLGGPGVVKQLVARGCEHLRHDVLIHVAQVSREFVGKEFLVDDIFGDVFVPEGEGDK